jgi:hypothetical protein
MRTPAAGSGTGFLPVQATLFRTLEPEERAEGTGIGLAVVKKLWRPTAGGCGWNPSQAPVRRSGFCGRVAPPRIGRHGGKSRGDAQPRLSRRQT